MLLTGAMCVIATGSSAQILIAILLVLFFMLLVFKTAPFVDDVDDWLSFLTSLQMLLTLLGGFALLTDSGSTKTYNRDTFGHVLVMINCTSLIVLLLSIVALHPRVRACMLKCSSDEETKAINNVKVTPEQNETDTSNSSTDLNNSSTDLRSWGGKVETRADLKEIRKKYGSNSLEYKEALVELGNKNKKRNF